VPRATVADVLKELKAQRLMLADIQSALSAGSKREQKEELKMAKKLAEIVADIEKNNADQNAIIAQQTTVIDGVKVHLQGTAAVIAALKAQVEELIAAGGDPVQLARLEELSAAMDAAEAATTANTDALAAALVANT
jgi:deoxyribodipyrimidine photolyase-like uncharacterized protein